MGVLTGIVANIADQEIGATKVDPRLLQAAELLVTSRTPSELSCDGNSKLKTEN